MKKLLVGFLLGLAVSSFALPLDQQSVLIRWAMFRYPGEEAFFRAILRFENGRKGSEAGLNPVRAQSMNDGDIQAYADPTAPAGAEQHCRLARRISIRCQRWIFQDPKRRAEFMEYWSEDYLRGGLIARTFSDKKRENYRYFRELQKVYNEERELLKLREKAGGYNPVVEIRP